MTRLGSPGVSSRSVSCFFGPFRPENPETDWDDKPGLPRRVIPVRFRFFDQNRKKSPGPEKHPKGLLLQKEFNSGMRGAIYLYFHYINKEQKNGNGPGRHAWEAQACHPRLSSRSVSGLFDQNREKSPGPEKHPKWLLLQKEFNSGMRGAIHLFFH